MGIEVTLRFSLKETYKMAKAIKKYGHIVVDDVDPGKKIDSISVKYIAECVALEYGEKDPLSVILDFIRKESDSIDPISTEFLSLYQKNCKKE